MTFNPLKINDISLREQLYNCPDMKLKCKLVMVCCIEQKQQNTIIYEQVPFATEGELKGQAAVLRQAA